ncbi:unnamed protein product, partial [Polarella glacialis]
RWGRQAAWRPRAGCSQAMGAQACGGCQGDGIECLVTLHDEGYEDKPIVTSWLSDSRLQPSFRSTGSTHSAEEFQPDIGQGCYLGCSSIGTVVKALHRSSNCLRAVRQISKKHVVGDLWKAEVTKLQNIDHPNVCKLLDCWEDAMNIYLVMELCLGGNLMSVSAHSSTFSEAFVATLMLQMVKAVACLHAQGIVHSDIRPENWLFEQPVESVRRTLNLCLKMIDFGLTNKHARRGKRPSWRLGSSNSRQADINALPNSAMKLAASSSRRPSGGKSSWEDAREVEQNTRVLCQAPEQVGAQDAPSNPTADIWSLGVIAYFLLSGHSPFEAAAGQLSPQENTSFRNARYVFMPSETWRSVSREAKHFIALCLQLEPLARPSAVRLLQLHWIRMAQGAVDHEMRAGTSYASEGSTRSSENGTNSPPFLQGNGSCGSKSSSSANVQ